MSPKDSRSKWTEVKAMMNMPNIALGPRLSDRMLHAPRDFVHMMSYYKFASKLIGPDKRVLDIGCREGFGTWLLGAECGFAEGIDADEELIRTAQANFRGERVAFGSGDLLSDPRKDWGGIVSIDHLEHLRHETAERFVAFLHDSLAEDGVAVVGAPAAAPETGQAATDSSDRLGQLLNRLFKHVFVFGAHEDVIEMGFLPVSHYFLVVACGKRELSSP